MNASSLCFVLLLSFVYLAIEGVVGEGGFGSYRDSDQVARDRWASVYFLDNLEAYDAIPEARAGSGTYEIWDGTPSECLQFEGIRKGMPVYLQAGVKMTDIVQALNNGIFNLKNSIGGPFPECLLYGLRSICVTWLREAVFILSNSSLLFTPRNPCPIVYDLVYRGCYPAAAALGVPQFFGSGANTLDNALPMTLNWTDSDIEGRLFYQEAYEYLYPNGTYSGINVTCNGGGPENLTVVLGTCESPLEERDGLCVASCPLPPATRDEYDSMIYVEDVLSSISIALVVVMMVVTLCNPRTRRFPQSLQFPVYFWLAILSIGVLYPGITGDRNEEIWCEGNEYVVVTRGKEIQAGVLNLLSYTIELLGFSAGENECAMQGMMIWMGMIGALLHSAHLLVYGSIAIVCALRSIDINGNRWSKIANGVIACAFVLCISAIGISLWIADLYKFGIASVYCFIDKSEEGITIALWIVPIYIIMTVCIVATLAIVLMVSYRAFQLGIRNPTFVKFMYNNAITIAYSLMLVIVYTAVAAFSTYFIANKDTIETNTSNEYICTLNPAAPACLEVEDTSPYVRWMWVQVVVTSSLPIVISLVWISRPSYWIDQYQLWKQIITKGRFSILFDSLRSRSTKLSSMTQEMSVVKDNGNDDSEEDDDDDGYTDDKTKTPRRSVRNDDANDSTTTTNSSSDTEEIIYKDE